MSRFISALVLVCLALVPARSGAQEPLTLDRAIEEALAQNAALRAVRAGTDESAARRAEARSSFLPRVSFTESWQRGNQPVFVFSSLLSARRFGADNLAVTALNRPEPIASFRAGVAVEQMLFDGGRRRSAARVATLRHSIAGAAAREAAADLAVTTTQVFLRILTSEAAGTAAEAGIAAAREDLGRAERRRDAGLATDADVLALAVHLAELQQRAIQASGDASAARAELNRLMGRPVDAVPQVLVLPDPAAAALTEEQDLTSLLTEAEAARPDLARALASEQVAMAARRQALAALVPQVAAQAAVDVAGTRFADRQSSWVAGGELRWTLSTGGAEVAAMKAAAASLARSRAEAEDVRAAVHVDVVSAVARVASSRARHAVARATVDHARETQRIVRDRFEAGLASVTDVLRASTAVLQADGNNVSALADTIVARAMLQRALGRTPQR